MTVSRSPEPSGAGAGMRVAHGASVQPRAFSDRQSGPLGAEATQMLAARLRLLHKQSNSGMLATFPALLVMTAVLWQAVPTFELLAWVATALTVNTGRLLVQRRYPQVPETASAQAAWRRRFMLGAGLGGLCNGACALLLIQDGNITEQVFLMLILGGLTAGALSTLTAVYDVYRAYTVMALLSPIGMSLARADSWHLAVGGLLVLYLLLMLRTARHLDDSLARTLALRFENLDLIENLREVNQRQESINRELAAEIAQRCAAELALQREKERALVTVESIGDAVITTDERGRIDYLNPTAVALAGCSAEQARGEALDDALHLLDEDSGEPLRCLDAAVSALQGTTRLPGEPVIVNPGTGERHSVQITLSPIHDTRAGVAGVVLVLHDVTDMRQLARQMSYQASHDALTGLMNRRAFDARMHETCEDARHAGSEHALLLIDLDRFKIVNDTCGHAAGDALLRRLAAVFTDTVRGGDVVARLGGDEFAVLLRACPLAPAQSVAEKLRAAVEALRFDWDDEVFEIGASIGVVPITASAASRDALMKAADAACYRAKAAGRNRVEVAAFGAEP